MKPCDVVGCGQGLDHTITIGNINFACCNHHLERAITLKGEYEKAKIELNLTYFKKLRNLCGETGDGY
jgi:hypothetical protein